MNGPIANQPLLDGGSRLHYSNWRLRVWLPARVAAGLPELNFHDLKHTPLALPSLRRESTSRPPRNASVTPTRERHWRCTPKRPRRRTERPPSGWDNASARGLGRDESLSSEVGDSSGPGILAASVSPLSNRRCCATLVTWSRRHPQVLPKTQVLGVRLSCTPPQQLLHPVADHRQRPENGLAHRVMPSATVGGYRSSCTAAPKVRNGFVGLFEDVDDDHQRGLVRLVRGRLQHQERVAANFDTLVAAMMPSLSETDVVPAAMVAQAQRRAELRSELLATGAFTYKALADGRLMKAANLRQWVRRARDRFELFTVEYDNETLVPAFLLDADLLPRPAFQPVIAALAGAGEDGWGLWAWLVHPTSWLDGKVPAEELERNPEAVLRAAQDRASNAA